VTIPAEADALEALVRMQKAGTSRFLVATGNRILGIVALKDLLKFLNLKLELEGESEGKLATTALSTMKEPEDSLVHH
jgi:hypothetical protein